MELLPFLPQLQSNCATDVGEARPDLDGLLTVTPASPSQGRCCTQEGLLRGRMTETERCLHVVSWYSC